jgi:hypothetical protein
MLDVLVALDLAQHSVRAQFDTVADGSGNWRRSSGGARRRFSLRRRRTAARAWSEGTARSSGTVRPAPGRS